MSFWLASFTNRWHTDPVLSKTNDMISGHQQRVSMLVLTIDPNISRDALVKAITHDQGEYYTGDLSYTFKRDNPNIRAAVKSAEEDCLLSQGFSNTDLTEYEEVVLSLADWLDAYLWAMLHDPYRTSTKESWQKQKEEVLSRADHFGVREQCEIILFGALDD